MRGGQRRGQRSEIMDVGIEDLIRILDEAEALAHWG